MIPGSQPPIIEVVSKVTPFGVRFWDVLTQSPVQGGLRVTVFRPEKPLVRLPVFPNRVGVYVIQGVPGLIDFETGSGDAEFWRAAPPGERYMIEVVDPEDRFMPCVFEAAIPTRWLFQWPCVALGSPVESPPVSPADAVPLFSTPYRSVLGGMAVVRAQLTNPISKKPVAWARLSVSMDEQVLAEAISGPDGSVTASFPFPERQEATEAPLASWSWPIGISVAHPPPDGPWRFPDLCDLLNQSPAQVWSVYDPPATLSPLGDQTLAYGQELILRSQLSDGSLLSKLYIT